MSPTELAAKLSDKEASQVVYLTTHRVRRYDRGQGFVMFDLTRWHRQADCAALDVGKKYPQTTRGEAVRAGYEECTSCVPGGYNDIIHRREASSETSSLPKKASEFPSAKTKPSSKSSGPSAATLLKMAKALESSNPAGAAGYYRDILKKHPGAPEAMEAEKKLKALENAKRPGKS
jgi:hypothetical protein